MTSIISLLVLFVGVMGRVVIISGNKSLESSQIGESRIVHTNSDKLRGVNLNVGIPVPNVPLPDPWFGLEHTLDYWPYKKFYTVEFSRVYRIAKKVFWYFYEVATLGFRILFQLFDIFQMRKSFDLLSQKGWGSGGGNGGDHDDDWRNLGRLLTSYPS